MLKSDVHRFYLEENDEELITKYHIRVRASNNNVYCAILLLNCCIVSSANISSNVRVRVV